MLRSTSSSFAFRRRILIMFKVTSTEFRCSPFLRDCLLVLLYPELPSGSEGSGENVLSGFGQTDLGHAHPSPTAGNGQEDVGSFVDKILLLLGGEHEIPVAEFL